ncbi:MAG TPA: efflux RND transporter periplasmic adaptor subunit [Planctomycetaceae bacterium]|nr:efflux RND transporter periplasmic adaptor subunit [Planctomycetaceae bacterium]
MIRFSSHSACFLSILSVCSLVGCESSQADSNAAPPAVVIVSSPVEEAVVDSVDYTGRTDSAESVDIRSRVTGFLDKILFKDGSEVEKGAPLYRIDDREFQADLTAAKGELAKAKAEQQRTTADFTRVEGLRKKEAVTASQFDQSRAAKLEADAAVQSGTAKQDRAELNVTFSKIDAPIAGKISRSRITVGNLVDANSTVLTTIVSVDPMYVYFDVDERTLLALARETREGKLEGRKTATVPVYMGLTGEKAYPHAGTIDFLENRVNPETGTIRVRGVFSNPKPQRGERVIEAGLFARVRVPISKPKKALLVNERAIGTDQGQKFVYVVDSKDEVVFRPIQLGSMHEGLRVVTEGLNAGEKVIIDGLQRVRPGSVVSPKPGDMRSRPGEAVAAAGMTSGASDKADKAADSKPAGQHAE